MGSGGSSNRNIDYRCTVCGREVGRENLIIKRAQFTDMNGKVFKTRVVEWLCTIPNGDKPSCAELDPATHLPARSTSPGMKDTRMAQGVA